MSTTFHPADDDIPPLLAAVMRSHHPRLAEAAVAVRVVMAHNADGPAVKHAGYAALATIKVVSLKDRLTKGYDAEVTIDETEWRHLRDEQRAATLDHELCHIDLVPLTKKELKELDGESARTWKLDDLGRPKLRSVPGDWSAGDGFRAVVERHGADAVEYLNLTRAKATADAARRRGGADAETGRDVA